MKTAFSHQLGYPPGAISCWLALDPPVRQNQINMLSRALDHLISASCVPRDPALVPGGSCASIVESRAALDAHHGNGIKRPEQRDL
jgi:hypothetical protein